MLEFDLTPRERRALDTWQPTDSLKAARQPQPASRLSLAFLREQHGEAGYRICLFARWASIAPHECRVGPAHDTADALGVTVHPRSWQAPWHARHARDLALALEGELRLSGDPLQSIERHVTQLETTFIRAYLTQHPLEPGTRLPRPRR